ncbi:MAG TPA: hypothetical protein VE863_20270 [Pyrinomonadaceae bacterium]|jgi:cation transport ATPase|nr:hypothetical protein [Pyrinomonadaceae bacterium]
MENSEIKKASDDADDRRFALWASIVTAALFVIQLGRWFHGDVHWDDLLYFVAVLVIWLTRFFQLRGLAKLFSQVTTVALLVVLVATLFVHR